MTKFRKAILKVGRYHSPDGVVEVTADRLRHWRQQFEAMREAGQVVPIGWDHSDDITSLLPMSADQYKERRRSAKDTIGRLVDFRVAKDGQSAEVLLDLRTRKAVEQAKLNNVYVSPVIFPKWRDGAGNEYRDVITHVDFVNHPVDHSQGPFAPVESGALAMALRMGVSMKPYRMEQAMPDDTKDDQNQDGGGSSNLKDVLQALAKLDIVLPDDTDEANLLDRLHAALLTAAAQTGKDEGQDGGEGGDEGGDADVVTDPAIAALSLEAKQALAFAERQNRERIASRLKALLDSGRCSPEEYRERQGAVKAIKLSLDDDGNPRPSELEHWITAREAVPKGSFWDDQQRLRMSAETVVDPPPGRTGEPTEEEVEKTLDFVFKRKTAG